MTASLEQRSRVAQLLSDVASGVVTPSTALKLAAEWKDLPWCDSRLEDAYHLLQHFEADADIRQGDGSYADAQVKSLLRLAERLREGGE